MDKVVDAHVHLPVYDGLVTLREKRDRLLRDMDRDGVDMCVVISDSELESCIGSMEDCVRLFKGEERVRVVCGISPLIDFDAQLIRLRRHIVEGEAAGIKLFPGHERFYLSDGRLGPVWRLAEEYGVPVLFHSGWDDAFYASAKEVRTVLEAHPGVAVVCCHCFYPDVRECLELTGYPGLMFDISSVADDPVTAEKLAPQLKELILRAPERVMFGTDYSGCERAPHVRLIENMGLDAKTERLVMAGNALALYARDAGRQATVR